MPKMNKQEFLARLEAHLSELPQKDVQDRIGFYSEMIDDRMEEGSSEEDAIQSIGSTDEIAAQIIEEIPVIKIVNEQIRPKRKMQAWETVLLILGAPIWLSLLISVFAVILSVYVSAWAAVISLWAVFVSLLACALSGSGTGLIFLFCNHTLSGTLLISASLVCAGLSIFVFFGCKAATKGIILITKYIALKIKNTFIKKGEINK